MKRVREFERCIYCFEKRENPKGVCPYCGYENGFCDMPVWWLSPGTILKGRYVIGKPLKNTDTELTYLGWDLQRKWRVEITEYFPVSWVTRDITVSDKVSCIPGHEKALETGKQSFFEKAKLYYQCISRVEPSDMNFFVRNDTCYYVREKSSKSGK